MNASEPIAPPAAAPARPSPLKALGMLVGAIVLIAGYLALCGVLKNAEFYTGFLFLLCWSALEHCKLEKLPHTVVGAALGLALGYALHGLIAGFGATGGYLFGALVLPLIYFQMMGWLPLFVNFTTMTFLAVITIPHIQAHGDFVDAAIALAAGMVYFGLALGIPGWLGARRAAAATVP